MQELAQNILDIAMNSVAVHAGRIEIDVTESTADAMLTIRIADNGIGMDEETVRRVTDPFYTTRTTRHVGLGIPFFKMQAEMTGGTFEIRSKPGEGTEITASFHTDHIDFIPIGDLPETVMTLVSASPDTDLTVSYRKDDQEMALDTREIRDVLGSDVPLDTPQVLIWIRDNLREQYEELQPSPQS